MRAARGRDARAHAPADIDFKVPCVYIRKSLARIGDEDLLNPPKTPQSYRRVTMPNFLTEELAEYLRLRGPSNPDTHIFPSMTKHLLHHEMTRGAKIAGVKRIRIHDLRHSHASMLVAMGMTVPSITARLGHSGETVTHRYIHLMPGSEATIAAGINRMMSDGAQA